MYIETEDLNLRQVEADDARSLMELFSDPVAMQYFPSTRNLRGVREWIREVQQRDGRDGHNFLLIERKADSATLGYCGLILQEDIDGVDEVEVGYGLIRRFWHHGYATIAARACLSYGFHVLGLQRIISLIRPENTPSIAVALRNGLRQEKSVVKWDLIHDVYAISRDEFDTSHARD
jgi:[ribosomal protein S5]-alanine N-acetyltransferase